MKVKINAKNRERIGIAERMGQPDRVPFDFSLADQFDFLHAWLHLDGRRYFLDPAYVLDAQARFVERFGGDGILGPSFGVAVEPSFFGAEVVISPDASPWVRPLIRTVDELRAFLTGYKEPDPYSAGYFPLLSTAWCYFRDKLGDLIGSPMGFLGPFDTAGCLLSHTNLFTWIKEEPNLIHELLDRITNFFLKSLEVRVDLFKPRDTNLAIYDDSPGLISRSDFLSFEFPYVKRLYDSYCHSDSLRSFHCDARLSHIADLLPEMGVNVLLGFDPQTDIGFFKEKIGNRVCLKGNVHPLKFMLNGTAEEVDREVKRQIKAAKAGGGLVITPGGELDGGTPPANIDALLHAVEEYGGY